MRLIDADLLIGEFMKISVERSLTHKKDRMTFRRIREIIDEQPSVEPVQCRSCENSKIEWLSTFSDENAVYCAVLGIMCNPSFSCALAERRHK